MSAKQKKKQQKRHSGPPMAQLADRHELYEQSVQDVESEIDFVDEAFVEYRGRTATILREDFCGPSLRNPDTNARTQRWADELVSDWLDSAEAGPRECADFCGDLIGFEVLAQSDEATARTFRQPDKGMGQRLAV